MNVPGITNSDMSATINGAVKAGWVYVGTSKNHTTGRIQWPATGEVVNFSTTPKSGGWKTVAQQIFAASGVDLRRKGSTRRSRKNFTAADPQVAAARRRHSEQFNAKREAEARHEAEIRAIQAAERRRREIEELMR